MKNIRVRYLPFWEEPIMPSINRIRVNNVKYNFGTQMYDDFTMRLYGRDTLYDLANGGGKSVLMLLLMQCVIPNSTLDEKQPIEKLFRENCGNTTIHSLIEWKVDEPDIEDGYKYMTTGFCARKSRDRDAEAEKSDVASIDYFNYCIFYREYNRNDIVNLPLIKDKERISYQALKNYLQDLSRKDNNLRVFVFDRKGEYQRFISNYGLHESQWEIIRGINKTEGHVRTYFESNYKTTRKVIEDLLIEEIIEKAYRVKTNKDEGSRDSAADLLMSIKDQLKNLAEKKKDIAVFDHETELISLLYDRIISFNDLYKEEEEISKKLGDIYVTGEAERKNSEEYLLSLKKNKENAHEYLTEKRASLENLRTSRDKKKYETIVKELDELQSEAIRLKDLMEKKDRSLKEKKAAIYFLDLLNDKAKYEKVVASTKAEHIENEEELLIVVGALYKIFKKEEEDLIDKIKVLSENYDEICSIIEKDSKVLEEARVGAAVADSNILFLKEETERIKEDIRSLREGISEVAFDKTENIIAAKTLKKDSLTSSVNNKVLSLEQVNKEIDLAKKSVAAENDKLFNLHREADVYKERDEIYRSNEGKLKQIRNIYASHDPEGTDMYILSDLIREKTEKDIIRIAEIERELRKNKKRAEEIKHGRIIKMSSDVEKVIDYITTRHGSTAMFGADYLAALTVERRQELLEADPELPYSVIAENFGELAEDPGLIEMTLNECPVIIYDKEKLGSTAISLNDAALLVKTPKNHFLDEKEQDRYFENVNNEIDNLKNERLFLSDALKTEREDLLFVLRTGSKENVSAADDLKRVTADIEKIVSGIEKIERNIENLKVKGTEIEEAISKDEERIHVLASDIEILEKILVLENSFDEKTKALDQAEASKARCVKESALIQDRFEDELNKKDELNSALRERKEELKAKEDDWNSHYQPYYQQKNYPEDNRGKEELIYIFKSYINDSDQQAMDEEKNAMLLDTLESSIRRQETRIKETGVDLASLMAEYEAGTFVKPEEDELNHLKLEIDKAKKQSDEAVADLSKKKDEAMKLSGSIDYAIQNISAAYGEFNFIDLSYDEYDMAIRSEEEELKKAKAMSKEAEEKLDNYKKQQDVMADLYRDVKRIVERNNIDTSYAVIIEGDRESLRDHFEELLLSYDRIEKAIERAGSQMLKTKGQVTESLSMLGAFQLAASIRDDIETPKTYAEATVLLNNLDSMKDLIRLEKERVDSSLSDMERLKNNFVDQCIERCLDVKTELDKLPKLSQIVIGNESIQMIKLSIPYIKDEFIRERMADYIDKIVETADKKENDAERIKFLQSELAIKKMFSVIVTDMNKIKLQLYKRERIKEQSRYLKYEEAVGSTGQSQGIYIQFLVSVINYISGMYAISDADKRTKTIFIDNPFGAAKDIYIWEPIFALLRTNHVQLIVPSRGATPEITGKFDVNYVLGQQMASGKQVTVVVRYDSHTNGEELEYNELDYEQATFDFI